MEFELQYAVGDAVRGPFDVNHLRQQVYMGLLTGDERIRAPGGSFEPMAERPEFAEVVALVGRRAPVARGTLPRWKPSPPGPLPATTPATEQEGLGASAAAPPEPARPEVAPSPSGPREFQIDTPRASGRGRWRLVAGAVVVLVGLALLLAGTWWLSRG